MQPMPPPGAPNPYGPPPGAPQPGVPYGAAAGPYAPPPAPVAAPKKGGCGGRGLLIGGGLAVVALLGCGGIGVGLFACGGLAMLQGLVGGKRSSVAHEHLPATCQAVVRIDAKGLMNVGAVKAHVVPAIDEQAKKDPEAGKLAAFLATAGLDPKKDLTEAVVCVSNVTANEPDIIGIIGGSLRPNGVITALELHAKKGEFKPSKEVDGLKVLEAADEPVFITQAADGAIIIANRQALLFTAASPTSAYKAYNLSLTEQASGVLMADGIKALNDKAGPMNPLGTAAANAGRTSLSVSLDTGKVILRVQLANENDAAEVNGALNVLLAQGRRETLPDPMLKEAIDSASVKAEGKEVVGSLVIPQTAIDAAAKEIAKGIREAENKL